MHYELQFQKVMRCVITFYWLQKPVMYIVCRVARDTVSFNYAFMLTRFHRKIFI